MPVLYRRPDPSAVAAAQLRLRRLRGGPGEAGGAPGREPAAAAPGDPPGVPLGVPLGGPTGGPPGVPPGVPLGVPPAAASGPAEPPTVDRQPPGAATEAAARLPGDASWGRLRAVVAGWAERLVPAALRGSRLDPGRPGVAAIAAVAVLSAALSGYVVWRARPHAVAVTAPPVTRAGPAVAPSSGPVVVVAVAGGVRRPGLITLPPGSRVADALRAAGGVRPGVDVGLLNLARRLVDGEQVVVGASAPPLPGSPVAAGGTLNLNTATAEQLEALPGVGPVLASRIVSYRTQHGAFRSVDQLREVSGIGEAKFADLRPLVSV